MRAWPPRALRVGPWACGLLGTVAAVLGARAQSPTAAAPAGAAAPDAGAGIELGVRVVPDTVRIGEPFVVAVRVRAPVGAAVRFPAGLDSGGAVEAIDPPLESTNERATATDETARYRVAAWDLGLQPLTLPPVVVRVGDDSRSVRVGRLTVMVAPVAPAESPSRQARPARPVFATPSPRWWPWMLAAAALVALVLAERARWRRRRPPARSDVVDARAVADAEFA